MTKTFSYLLKTCRHIWNDFLKLEYLQYINMYGTCRCTVNIPVCSTLFIRPIFLCKVIMFGSKVYLQYMYTFTIALQKVRKFQKDTWHFLKEKLEQRGTLSCVTEMWPPPSTFKTTTLWTAQGAEIQVCTIILVHIIILYSTSNHSKFKMHTDDYSMKVIILFQMQHWEILLLCFQYSDNEQSSEIINIFIHGILF